jgi:hypothetical protein
VRRAHYLPGNKSCELPANCIWFDTETQSVELTNDEEIPYLWFGYAAFRRRRDKQHWCEPEWLRFTTRAQFWDWVTEHCRDRCRLHIFCHNGQFDLPVLDAFNELPDRGFKLTSAIVECPPMMLVWKRGRQTIRFIDTLNLWRLPLSSIGDHVGLPKLPMPKEGASLSSWDVYGKRDVEIIMAACLKWFGFLRDHDLGGFAPTLASQALTTFRHRFMEARIVIDDNEEALALARQAYKGGRTECFKLGRYEGTFYHVDVNSMYPAVMRSESYPVALVGVYSRNSLKELGECLAHYRVIADVDIETRTPCYPKVVDGRLCFPVGRFRAQLSSPELEYGLARGHIRRVYPMSLYTAGRPFGGFVEFFYRQRRIAAEAGDDAAKWFLKILPNSLYGKFGQRGRRYETESVEVDSGIKVWAEINAQTREITRHRQFGGIRQHFVEEGESRHSHPAIAAHIAAYARMKLWGIIQAAGRTNCWYTDTDSVVVNQEGYARLSGQLDDVALGALKLEATYRRIELFAPKDYLFDGERKTKGVSAHATWRSDNEITQSQFVGFKGLLNRGHLHAPIIRKQEKVLARVYTKGRPQADGRVLPLRLSDW